MTGQGGTVRFDVRSAASRRTSGWERYARELWRRLCQYDFIEAAGGRAEGIASRLISDISLGLAARQGPIHFPTFPPAVIPAEPSRLVYTLHDLTWWRYPETASRLGRNYYRHLAARAARRCYLVTHSETVASEAREFFGRAEGDVVVVRPGVTPLPTASLTDLPADVQPDAYLLAVATLEPRKNLQRLVDAHHISGLARQLPLIIVGRVAWGKAPEGVRILTSCDDRTLSALYKYCVALISPSLYEGFGLPLLEAMAVGARVACADIPVYREVARRFAVFFDPRDTENIADALLRVATEPSFSRAGAQTWALSHTWDRAAERLLEVYREILP